MNEPIMKLEGNKTLVMPDLRPRNQKAYKWGSAYKAVELCGNCRIRSMINRFCIICGMET